MRAWELSGTGLDSLRIAERPTPEPGPREVLVRMRTASLNFRDLLQVRGLYGPRQPQFPAVLLSDGAGEVVAMGRRSSRFRPGQRVMTSFFQSWLAGPPNAERFDASLAGPLDGVLCDYRCFDEDGLVAIPDHLSDEAAATLPCAGVTAWSALFTQGALQPGDTVLVQGTGGVSLFALQFAKLAGARVIVTSSSAEKLARAAALGADRGIDYRAEPEWGKAVRQLTGDRGVDHVIEVGGAGTLRQSIRAVRIGGTISMIGVLSGPSHELLIPLVVMQNLRLQGVTVGSRDELEAMLRAMALHHVEPVIDRVFAFEETPAAFTHMAEGRHFGKIVIRIS